LSNLYSFCNNILILVNIQVDLILKKEYNNLNTTISMSKYPEIVELINKSPILSAGDKGFLVSIIDEISPLQRLKLEGSLMANTAPELLTVIQNMRGAFFKQEIKPQPDFITKIVQKIAPAAPKKIYGHSVLSQPVYLGGNIPHAPQTPKVAVQSLANFSSLTQLNSLTPYHITFGLNDNSEQILRIFFTKLDELFEEIHDIEARRGYFMLFLQSVLYTAYMDTGLTALRHPEITPSQIVLNRLQQIHPKYLSTVQFQISTKVCAHLRMLCSI
jgi:hypothetical protein